jgi:biopolymer transport protein ExbD
MRFQKKEKAKAEIPQASLPDILFILLMFFMASTVFREYRGLPIIAPAARSTEKIDTKRNISYVWVDRINEISIDDQLIAVGTISNIIGEKFQANRRLIISLKVDKEVKMGMISDIQEELREAYALRVNYSTRMK